MDDELLLRISLRVLLDELGQINSNIVDAECGEDMLKLLESEHFDIAFVDIKMPGISGLEAIKRAKEISPATVYYILTGFSEFEYAQKAVPLGVEDYLLKPVSGEKLSVILERAEQTRIKLNNIEQASVLSWIDAAFSHSDTRELQFSGWTLPFLIVNDSYEIFSAKDFTAKLQNIVESELEVEIYIVEKSNYTIGMLFSQQKENLLAASIKLQTISVPALITLYMSSPRKGNTESMEGIRLLETYSNMRPLQGIGGAKMVSNLTFNNKSEINSLNALCIEIRACIQNKQFANLIALIDSLKTLAATLNIQQHKTYLNNITTFLSTAHIDLASAFTELSIIHALEHFCITQIKQTRDTMTTSECMVEYVNTHYCESLSVGDIAEIFGLTPNYCSSLFQKATGERFTVYITKLKILKAKQLMAQTTLSIKEITEFIGYYSQSHFIKLFLRYENCTPSEYKNMFNS